MVTNLCSTDLYFDRWDGGIVCLVELVSIAIGYRQGYFIGRDNFCDLFSDCSSLVRFVGDDTHADGQRRSNLYSMGTLVFPNPIDLCFHLYTQSVDR